MTHELLKEARETMEGISEAPWAIDYDCGNVVDLSDKDNKSAGVQCGEGFYIAVAFDDIDELPYKANARFIAAAPSLVKRLVEALERAEGVIEAVRLQASSWKGEAKTQQSIVHEIYQIVSEAKGEPADWNGAKPVRDRIAELEAENAELIGALQQIAMDAQGSSHCDPAQSVWANYHTATEALSRAASLPKEAE